MTWYADLVFVLPSCNVILITLHFQCFSFQQISMHLQTFAMHMFAQIIDFLNFLFQPNMGLVGWFLWFQVLVLRVTLAVTPYTYSLCSTGQWKFHRTDENATLMSSTNLYIIWWIDKNMLSNRKQRPISAFKYLMSNFSLFS